MIPYFTPKRGGVVNVCYNLSKNLAKRGHDITIITTDFEFDQKYANSLDGIRVIPFKCLTNIGLFLYSPEMNGWIRENIRNFDIIHLHEFRSYQNIVVHKYSEKFQIPYILQAHGSLSRQLGKAKLKFIYDFIWGNQILTDASIVIALTPKEAEEYGKCGAKIGSVKVVPNGLGLSEYENLPKRGEFGKKHGLNGDEKIVLYVGRLHKTKGIDLLVKAFADVSKELGNAKLVIVGPDYGYKSVLEGLAQSLKISDKVLFTGFVSNDEKMAAFVDGDVLVLPSFSGFPIIFLEACACGMPIITTNNGDNLGWIHDNVGYVVDYDKYLLRDAIFKVLSDQKLRREFGIKGKQLIRERFGWSGIIEEIENIYKDVTRGTIK